MTQPKPLPAPEHLRLAHAVILQLQAEGANIEQVQGKDIIAEALADRDAKAAEELKAERDNADTFAHRLEVERLHHEETKGYRQHAEAQLSERDAELRALREELGKLAESWRLIGAGHRCDGDGSRWTYVAEAHEELADELDAALAGNPGETKEADR